MVGLPVPDPPLARAQLRLRPWRANDVTAAVLERCGFVQEGRLRQHMTGHDGTRVDTLLYGLLPDELT